MKRRGFTLVELIVAMGIIVLLLALGTYGVRSMLANQREANTRQTIQTINSVLSERTRSVGGNIFPAAWYHNGVYGMHNGSAPGLWISPFRDATTLNYQPTTIVDASIPDDPALWTSDLLRNTVIAFHDVDRSSAGRRALDATPTRDITVLINGAPMRARIPLDGWGRPLLFAPGIGVTVDGVTVYQQSTTSTYSVPFGGKGGTFPFVFSAGREGNPSDLQNAIR